MFGKRRDSLFSVVIPTHNEGEMLRQTVESILLQTTHPSFEIIIVDDGSTDGSCERYQSGDGRVRVITGQNLGIPRARNLGAESANGEYVLFLDAHCRVSPDWLTRFMRALRKRDVGVIGPCFTRLGEPEPRGCGMIWINTRLECSWLIPLDQDRPYEVPITPGGCQAFRMETFKKLGGFDDGFTRWGFQDEEICVRAWLTGYRVQVDPGVVIQHFFRDKTAYQVNDEAVLYNYLRMIHLHFSPPRIRQCIAALGDYPGLENTIDRLYESDLFERRAAIDAVRVRDDDWYFKLFDLPK
jgi:glycosyltransferase involved in cell wall biosynthesis